MALDQAVSRFEMNQAMCMRPSTVITPPSSGGSRLPRVVVAAPGFAAASVPARVSALFAGADAPLCMIASAARMSPFMW